MSKPSLYVADTNVLIDVSNGGVVTHFHTLLMSVCAPNVIVAEAKGGVGPAFLSHGMREFELSIDDMLEAQRLRRKRPKVSFNDMCAYVVARNTRAILLTGDKCLRTFAEEQRVKVHGVLWVLDELVRLELLAKIEAAKALQSMIDHGSRLPQNQCEKRLLKWAFKTIDGQASLKQ